MRYRKTVGMWRDYFATFCHDDLVRTAAEDRTDLHNAIRGARRCRDGWRAERAVLAREVDERSAGLIEHYRGQVQRLESALHDYRAALAQVAGERDREYELRRMYQWLLDTEANSARALRAELRERAEALDEESGCIDVLAKTHVAHVAAEARADRAEAELAKLRERRCGTCGHWDVPLPGGAGAKSTTAKTPTGTAPTGRRDRSRDDDNR